MKVTEGHVVMESEYRTRAPRVYWDACPRPEAAFAMELIERWGMVAAVEDGEDSQGRARLRALTPKEVVAKAIETAELAYLAMDERGWFLKVPPPEVDSRD